MGISLAPYQIAAINNPFDHFCFYAGISAGKTRTGAQWAINRMKEDPRQTGFIGSNTFDQLSQATLRELFYWLDHEGIEYVIDRQPPPHWNWPRQFKKYQNILSVRIPKWGRWWVVTIFVRTLSDPDALRGIEFTWYWIDETRDTAEYTHDVILSRTRESERARGFVTTTTNGEDWTHKRFIRGASRTSRMYGSMHVPTYEAVKAGFISQHFYDTLRRTYSPLMAAQELDAQHVNVFGGRAYYAASERNRARVAPWGAYRPDPNYPLIVGCDFNFSPAPCTWMVGQLGPHSPWEEHIHWFGELSMVETGTVTMTRALVGQYPDFHYRVFGDASGNKGTTSNMGETDYILMANTFNELNVTYSIDVDQSNPRVKDRVETMNASLLNAMGEVRQTYNPDMCPLFDGDLKTVGWKNGKLDSMGDPMRTHASDGGGYAVWKLLPIGAQASLVGNVASVVRQGL